MFVSNSFSFHLRTPRCEHRQNNQPTMSDLLPAVLLNALRQYKFAESPLWRMADGKDHVKTEVTFRKTTTNQRFDKKGAESRRRPTPPAGEWPRQPTAARRPPPPTTTRPTLPTPSQEKETSPPSTQILPGATRSTITHDRTQKTAIIEPAPIITRPTTPPPTPESPPKKKSRVSSPNRVDIEPPKDYNYFEFKNPDWYPVDEKYEIQDVRCYKRADFSVLSSRCRESSDPTRPST